MSDRHRDDGSDSHEDTIRKIREAVRNHELSKESLEETLDGMLNALELCSLALRNILRGRHQS